MLIEEDTCSDADDSDFPDVKFEGVKKVRNVEVEQSALLIEPAPPLLKILANLVGVVFHC